MSPRGMSHSVIVIRLSPIPVCGGRFQQGHRSLGSEFRQLLVDDRTFAIYIKVFYYNKLTYQIRKPDHSAWHRPAAQGAGHQVQHQPRNDPPPFLPASVCHQLLSRSNDLILLSDLLGHESVDTTRIYLQRSSKDQKRLISQVVDW